MAWSPTSPHAASRSWPPAVDGCLGGVVGSAKGSFKGAVKASSAGTLKGSCFWGSCRLDAKNGSNRILEGFAGLGGLRT